ncbi:peptidoglycan-binding protein [Halomarina salina]|uniref:Peptidoglycan-binding protein n=1 Tax=Halomarina salina TaxID=1872699 RepID=A0ABD5RMN0_9EURY|nr:peptidoglycan-binding protein [Halomarina salina]
MDASRRRRDVLKGIGGLGAAVVGVSALSGTAAAARYSQYDTDLRVTEDGVSGADLDDAIVQVHGDCPLVGLGDTWVAVGQEQGINSVYMAAHAAWESGWGESSIAQEKHNIYGYDARDACPSTCADGYASFEDCIREVMPIVRDSYLTPGGTYYNGPTLDGMNVNYATDDNWDDGIESVMNSLAEHIDFDGGTGGGGGGGSYSWPTYSNGDRGETVYTVQYLLEGHGYDLQYHDGIYGSEVESTVESFQSSRGLSVDGVVGPNTWEALVITVSGPTDDPYWPTYGAQHHLRDGEGYDIAVDGYYGSETEGAIESFQSDAGITVDGVVGPNTWQALVDVV